MDDSCRESVAVHSGGSHVDSHWKWSTGRCDVPEGHTANVIYAKREQLHRHNRGMRMKAEALKHRETEQEALAV